MSIRTLHGGKAFATAGGGGQGNHLGGAYFGQLRAVMGSPYTYNSLAQEKTGDFWVNGRMFGRQDCHTTEDIEASDYVVFIGCNPFQSHGIINARDTLKAIRQNPERTMVVVDPRLSETAKMADIHLQLKPGSDAYLLSALLAIIIRHELYDSRFITQHCEGFAEVKAALKKVPIEAYARYADVPLEDIEAVAHGIARARAACIRVDLGVQHTLHSTLNGYLEKLLYLLTGNFGKPGCNNLHSSLIPVLSHTDERRHNVRSVVHGMFPVSGILPPNILADEILQGGENRLRAIFVDSCNPLLTWPDTQALTSAFKSLELLVVTDVSMTETARQAHYVLPASSQFEKYEFTGFNMEFPRNGFHLRQPILSPEPGTLSEAEIYTRLLEKMNAIPAQLPRLQRAAKAIHQGRYLPYLLTLLATLAVNKSLRDFAPSIMYRSFIDPPDIKPQITPESGKHNSMASAAFLLPLSIAFAFKFPAAVRRAGHKGSNAYLLGVNLFRAIIKEKSGIIFAQHSYKDIWKLVKTPNKKIRLAVSEMLQELAGLPANTQTAPEEYPFILAAGERRAYNANQIFRNPQWRKTDQPGCLRIHPQDAEQLQLQNNDTAICRSQYGKVSVTILLDDSMRRGTLSLPHGYGQLNHIHTKQNITDTQLQHQGPALNLLTDKAHCDPWVKTPHHKYVPVRLEKFPPNS